jgi:flagellar biosynthesis/type III secretory pathway chaperone
VLEVLRRSLREGRTITKDELVKELVNRCGYRDVSGAYKLIKRLEKKGILKHAPGYGYTVPAGAEKESSHDRLIMQTLAMLLDMAWGRDFNINAKKKSLKDYYGERIPILAVKELMGNALLHIATSREDLAKELKEIARLGLLEKYEDLFKRWRKLLSEVEDLGRKVSEAEHLFLGEFIDEAAKILELGEEADARRYYEMVKKLIESVGGKSRVKEECYREVERFEDREILKRLCDKIDKLDEIAPNLSDMVKLEQLTVERGRIEKELEEIAGVLGRFYRVLVGRMRSFYIDAIATGRPKGWCRICAEWIDQELSHSIESLIYWLENREPEEISYMLEKWDPEGYLKSLEEKLWGY